MTVPFATSAALDVPHGFFGRRGGVSVGDFASLNTSETRGDDLNRVASNRAEALAAIRLSNRQLITLKQVHSNTVVVLTDEPDPAVRREADAIVTNRRDIALGILTADCAPILFADAKAGVVGAAHAGWKGAAGDIAYATVLAMVALGADPGRIHAAIGPTISGANYEVGPEFAAALIDKHPHAAVRITRPEGGREHFDLPGFIGDQLAGAGIGKVDDLRLCTYAEPAAYFSHRYATHHGATTGRQISIISL
jgi:polyphenol oxidase